MSLITSFIYVSLFNLSCSFINIQKDNTKFSTLIMKTFFDKIGRPRFISAPMVDQSELAFRHLVRKHGADLAFSQMMHARNFVNDRKYRSECIDWLDYSRKGTEEGNENVARQLDRPLIVQLAGDDPEILVKAGKYIQGDVSAIDLNLGCPQKIAKRGHYGAYLLPNKQLIQKILSELVTKLDVPITAKIRRLPSEEETIELCKMIESCGVQMLTVHGRTVENSKLFTGPADWNIIKLIKQSINIPVIANGGISCRDDALKCLEFTGADGVMSSEALLENPKLFSEIGDREFREDFVRSQLNTVDEYMYILKSFELPKPILQVVRGHLFSFLFRYINVEKNADLRLELAEGHLIDMEKVIDKIKQRMATVDFNTEEALAQGLISPTTWYMRHRDEKAESRILSRRRDNKLSNTSLNNDKNLDDRNNYSKAQENMEEKMQILKNRLLNKKNCVNNN